MAITTLISSCGNSVDQARLQKLDSLGTILNHVKELVSKVDHDMIEKRFAEMNEMGSWFLNNLEDTLPPEPGIVFGDYMRCQKFYGKAISRHRQVTTELEYSEKQLATLRADVKNGLHSDADFSKYFSEESASAAKLLLAAEELDKSYVSVNAQYVKTKPPVIALKDSIKAIILSSEPI